MHLTHCLSMKNLIKDWKRKKANNSKAHRKFLWKLSQHKGKRLDQFADEIHEEVFSHISCLDCANCCSSIPPIVNKTDAARIARHLGMKLADFEATYLREDEDKDRVINRSPCPFLMDDHVCLIYEVRPKACREYPHTNNLEFSQNFRLHAVNATYCPAVFHILEALKSRVPL